MQYFPIITGNPPTSFYEVYLGHNGILVRDQEYEIMPGKPTPISLSLRRPGGGTGGFSSVGQDQYMSADSAIINWLQNQPYRVDYCTDLDIHNDDGSFLGAYRLLISGSHDEYWSFEEKYNVEQFVQNSGHVTFLGANVAWKQVEIIPCSNAEDPNEKFCIRTVFLYDEKFWQEYGSLFQYLTDPLGANDIRGVQPPQALWWINSIFDPNLSSENSLTGQSYRNAGGRWYSLGQNNWESNPLGYYVQIDPLDNPYGWVFENTGLKKYDLFGSNSFLVDNECDGVFINEYDETNPLPPKVSPVTQNMDTHYSNLPPDGYVLLAASPELRAHGGNWNQFPPRTFGMYPGDNLYYFATMGIFQKGDGMVFSCGTTQWGRALLRNDPVVSQITINLIETLSGIR